MGKNLRITDVKNQEIQGEFSKSQILAGGSWLRSFQFEFLLGANLKGKVLDLGGGNGEFLRKATLGRKEVSVIELLDGHNLNAQHQVDLSSKDWHRSLEGRFDFVVCNNLLEHLREPSILLAQTRKVFDPKGGTLLIQTPFLFKEHMSPKDYGRYAPDWYKSTLELCGYEDVAIIKQGAGPITTACSMVLGPGRIPRRLSLAGLIFCRWLDRILAPYIFAGGKDFFIGLAVTAKAPAASRPTRKLEQGSAE